LLRNLKSSQISPALIFSLMMGCFFKVDLTLRSLVARIKLVVSLHWFRDNNVVSLTSITNEWPRGVTQSSSSAPEGIDLASTGSDISAELASVLKPR
jgi:hypothetical protein